jgi:hypothetical protein
VVCSRKSDSVLSPRWTPENRPYVDTSKAANGAELEQDFLDPAGVVWGKHFFDKGPGRICTDLTSAEDMATLGSDGSADSAAGLARSDSAAPQARLSFWRESDKSQGFGDRVPK